MLKPDVFVDIFSVTNGYDNDESLVFLREW